MKKILAGIFLVVSISVSGLTVQAATLTFFGEDIQGTLPPSPVVPPGGNAETARNSFLSHLASHSTEDFNSFSTGDTPTLNLSFEGGAGTIGATLQLTAAAGGGTNIRSLPSGGDARYATSGTNYFNSGNDNFEVTFLSPVNAFGFYSTDAADEPLDSILSVDLGNGSGILQVAGPGADPNIRNGSLLFFGVIDTKNPFTTVTFIKSELGDFIGYDDLIVGAVPIPAALPLFVSALGFMGFIGWKRKNAV